MAPDSHVSEARHGAPALVRGPSGFVLAGGLSSRMGQDKALLLLDGEPLIDHALRKLEGVGLSARIVGRRPDLAGYAQVVEDLRPGCGPLGGMEAALAASTSQLNLFLPVDLPLLPVVFLQWMLARAAVTGAAATIPLLGGRPQPLCCVLQLELLPRISCALDSGHFKVMDALVGSVGETDLFNVEAIAPIQRSWAVEPPLHFWFRNLNRREDLGAFGLVRGAR